PAAEGVPVSAVPTGDSIRCDLARRVKIATDVQVTTAGDNEGIQVTIHAGGQGLKITRLRPLREIFGNDSARKIEFAAGKEIAPTRRQRKHRTAHPAAESGPVPPVPAYQIVARSLRRPCEFSA